MTQGSVITNDMRKAIGLDSERRTHVIELGAVMRFAAAIGDANPIFNDEQAARRTRYGGIVAPPTFLRSMEAGPASVELENPYPDLLDGGSEWEYLKPARTGDRITVTGRIANLFERSGRLGNMLFVVRETTYVNQFDALVARQRNTLIYYRHSAVSV